MEKYLTLFNNHQAYTNYKNSNNFATPNVSYCEQENEVHYNPFVHDYSQDYFTTIAKESGTITFTYTSGATTDAFTSMSYKKNDGEWITIQYDPSNGNTINVSVNSGDKVQWKGINNAFRYYDESTEEETYGYFISTHTVDVEGNIMSLLYGDNFSDKRSLEGRDGAFAGLFSYDYGSTFLQIVSAENLVLPATTLADGCYGGMFEGCTSLTTAPELPATTLENDCYSDMFYDCTSLTTAPELPATTLAPECYFSMFNGCESLTTAPDLPATALTNYCYANMFNGCTNLTTAPNLPATTLGESCYEGMFNGCTSLTTAPELPATTLAYNCYGFMFEGCSSLTTAPELPATTLANNCYNSMFDGCTSLNYIKAMFTTTPSTTYTNNWVLNVSSTGTFVKNSAATWNVTGNNGIPTGWTVQTASA